MSTEFDVVFQHRAVRDIEEIHAWWRADRPAAPDLSVSLAHPELAGVLAARGPREPLEPSGPL